MASKNRKSGGLGRGLDALFADQVKIEETPEVQKPEDLTQAETGNSVVLLDINDIKPNENQPRRKFNEDKIRELADSIIEHGIIQPLVVRKKGNIFEIVAGERRWRASRVAGIRKVPCIIREFTDEENILVAMIENLQREDLNPMEEAMAFDQMIRKYDMTQEQVSKSVSKSRPYITNSLRLMKLPEEIQQFVSDGEMTSGHARALVPMKDRDKQLALAQRIVKEGLSVRETELLAQGVEKKRPITRQKRKDPNVTAMENRLHDYYGTKVQIDRKGKKGEIRLSYFGEDDLNRILDLLMPKQ